MLDGLGSNSSVERLNRLRKARHQSMDSFFCFQNVVQAFTTRAAECLESTAIRCGNDSVKFGELLSRSLSLARLLKRYEIGPDAPVGVSLPASIEGIVAILGVLRSGGAYVPLAPEMPASCLYETIQDVKIRVVLGWRPDSVPQNTAIFPPTEWGAEDGEGNYEGSSISPRQLAYVIHTSGSTGRSKGVMVDHGNLMASLLSRRAYYRRAPRVSLLLSPLAFDSSVAVIFPTLYQGGCLVIPTPSERNDPTALVDTVDSNGISDLLTLPAVYETLLSVDGAHKKLSSLERVILAGERLLVSTVKRHYETVPTADLFNEYGPTEGTVWTTVHHCSRADTSDQVPIGKAIPNAAVYILDSSTLSPVQPGEEGEIFVGGPGVARGYSSASDLTAERFLPDPHSNVPGTRVYRTGDHARARLDGTLEFIGRTDDQVKVRGYRVELGQIEVELSRHGGIRTCAAVIRTANPWKGNLIVFFERRPDVPQPTVGDLQKFLASRLAEYMLPAAYMCLAELPKNSNGKVDRKDLAFCPINASATPRGSIRPETPLEAQLCELWCSVLNLSEVSVLEHYLDFGGDSISVMQFVTAARGRGMCVDPADVLTSGTVATLAAKLEERATTTGASGKGSEQQFFFNGPFYPETRS